jgi:hypothetical protein
MVTAHREERDGFLAVAAEFCSLYETAKQLGSERFLLSLERVLPRLQVAAVELPYPDDELPDDELDVGFSQSEIEAVEWPVATVLGEIDWSRIQDDLKKWGEPTFAALVHEDLAGVYHDLKEGFRLLAAGRPESEAVFNWRLHFWGHWGYHNIEAMRVIHYYVAQL